VEIKAPPGKIQSISASVLIDEAVYLKHLESLAKNNSQATDAKEIKTEITDQVSTIIKGYDVPVNIAVNFVELKKTAPTEIIEETVWSPETQALIKPTIIILCLSLSVLLVIGIFIKVMMIKTTSPKHPEDENTTSPKMMLNEIHRKIHQNPEEASEKLKDWIKRS
jgi:flagellar biosynthesis/type III secretory pathway M-ring protein FliF/YscJ